jgi:hypothetical protein
MTDREIKREAWRKAAVKALAQGLDRDKLEGAIAISCAIRGKQYEDRDHTLTVIGEPKFKYIFTADDEIKTIIRDGRAYDENGERRYVAPKGRSK